MSCLAGTGWPLRPVSLEQRLPVRNAWEFDTLRRRDCEWPLRVIDRPVDLVDQSHKRLLDQSQLIVGSITNDCLVNLKSDCVGGPSPLPSGKSRRRHKIVVQRSFLTVVALRAMALALRFAALLFLSGDCDLVL